MSGQGARASGRAARLLLPALLLLLLAGLAALWALYRARSAGAAGPETALLTAANTLRRGETREAISLISGPEGTAVQVAPDGGEGALYTVYYLYQGQFCEHLYRADSGFDPALGNALCPAAAFSAHWADGLLTLELTGPEGEGGSLSLFYPARGEEGHG